MSTHHEYRKGDSIKRVAEEMVESWAAARQGDAEITLDIVDEWAHRIMCFADYVTPQPREVADDDVRAAMEAADQIGPQHNWVRKRMRAALESYRARLAKAVPNG